MQNLNEIAPSQIHTVVERMPKIELSYETNSHKKDDMSYRIGLAIPTGKKYYAWITYNEEGDNVIYMMEINREHKIARIFWLPYEPLGGKYEMGTIFYGTVTEDIATITPLKNSIRIADNSSTKLPVTDLNEAPLWGADSNLHRYKEGSRKPAIYLIEDILYDRGIPTKYFLFGQRIMATYGFLREYSHECMHIGLPIIWSMNEGRIAGDNDGRDQIPEKWSNKIGYQVHHIQYRCPNKIAPFVNIFFNKPSINIEGNLITCLKPEIREHTYQSYKCKFRADFNKPQYRMSTIFLVKADIDTDIYRLFAYGRNKTREYYDIAYIASYESSVFMNRLFRHIKENENLDFIEESDDEEEFENMNPERFVDLEKEVLIECIFSQKFKKWIPKRVVPGGKIVHIGQLCRDFL